MTRYSHTISRRKRTHVEHSGEYLTLADCAADVRVDVELVRRWCIAWESGDQAGLRSEHYGAESSNQAKRLNRRVRREDWTAFKAARARHQASETRAVSREWERVPLAIPTRQERRSAAAGGQGR